MTDPIRTSTKPAAPQLAVQFILRSGTVVIWPVPKDEPFAFGALINGIRSAGFFMAPDVYIEQEAIGAIGLMGPGAVTKIRQPIHPTRQ